jgi:hypothetical protein
MNKLVQWYNYNYQAITWFIIGWVSLALLTDFSKGDWLGCLLDAFLIAVNWAFVRR